MSLSGEKALAGAPGLLWSESLSGDKAPKALLEQYQTFFARPGEVVAVLDLNGTHRAVDDSYAEAVGLDPGELVGRTLASVVGEARAERLQAAAQESGRDREASGVVEMLLPGDKRRVWELCCTPLEMPPSFRGHLVRGLDVTRRHEEWQSLLEGRERYKALLGSYPGAVFMFDHDLRYVVADGCGADRDPALIRGRTIHDILPPDTAARAEVRFRDTLKGREQEVELRHEGRFWHVVLRPVRNPEGRVMAGMVLARDVTRQRLAEEQRRESEKNLLALLNAVPSYAYLCDREMTVLAANESGARDLNLCPEELAGRKLLDFLPSHVVERNQRHHLEMLAFRRPVRYRDECDGRVLDIAMHPVLDERGDRVERCALFVSDVTLEVQMERELVQARKMEAVGLMASGIAHEFNNILGIIMGFAQVGLDVCPRGGEIAECLSETLAAARRAGDVTRQLLVFSRGGDGKEEGVVLAGAVREGLGFLRATLPSSVKLESRIATGAARVAASPTQIQQILINLCKNAADAMPGGGSLRVEADDAGSAENEAGDVNWVRLAVVDNGQGMDQATLESAFDPFFSTKGPGMGTGMGLPVVRRIVENLGGRVELRSLPGQGTQALVWLRTKGGQSAALEPEPAEAVLPFARGGERILVVDDEPGFLRATTRLLEGLGYAVVGFLDPREALEAVSRTPRGFDLALVDQVMPRMSGDVLCQHLVEYRPDMPVIVATGYWKADLLAGQGILEAAEYLEKPFTKAQLAVAVRRALGHAEHDHRAQS